MGLGLSLIFIAVGAILAFAVTAQVQGVEVQTVGIILLVVGIIGVVLSLLYWSSWGGSGIRRGPPTYTRDYPPDQPPPPP